MNPLRLYSLLASFVPPIAAAAWLTPPAASQALHPREYQITMSPAHETRPEVGNDGISDLVVFGMQLALPDGSLAPADIWYQRIGLAGPIGFAVQVVADLTDDQFPDVHGDHIVYAAYDAVGSAQGRIVLYRISTRESWTLGEAQDLSAPRIHGRNVVWIERTPYGGTLLKLYDLAWLGTPQVALDVAGPVPPISDCEVGSRYVTWVQSFGGQYDVLAFDLDAYLTLSLTSSSGFDDLLPTTSGHWIVWMSQQHGSVGASLQAFDPVTYETRAIADDTHLNLWPAMDGDLVAYGSQQAGDIDLYLYRMSSARTYRITNLASEQRLPAILGDKLVYHDPRHGSDDVFLTVLDWAPVAEAGGDLVVTEGTWVILDGSASHDENGEAVHFAWTQTDGPPVVLLDADSATPGFLAPEVGRGGATLAFELLVTAGAYTSEPDAVSVAVRNVNRPPIAEAGEPQVVHDTGGPVLLDATGSFDPDGDPVTCTWVQVAGRPVDLKGADTPQAWFHPPSVRPPCEELKFRLVVSDGELTAGDVTRVTVYSRRRAKAP